MPETKPPPPPIMNLRFQASGSRSEKRMSFSMTPPTRQGAPRAGPVSAAGTATASVTFTSGSLSVVRCEHSACWTCPASGCRGATNARDRETQAPTSHRVFMGGMIREPRDEGNGNGGYGGNGNRGDLWEGGFQIENGKGGAARAAAG